MKSGDEPQLNISNYPYRSTTQTLNGMAKPFECKNYAEYKIEKLKQDLKMKFRKNYRDKRKLKEWE